MIVFPRLDTGALAQFPIRKMRRARTIINTTADGSQVKLADPAAEITEWRLSYSDLSGAEADRIAEFFTAAEGTLGEFTFLDPTANMLAWSERLQDSVWERGPLLTLETESGPEPGMAGWRLVNHGAGPQSIRQTLSTPQGYTYCLSLYARAETPVQVTLLAGEMRREAVATASWTRLSFTFEGDGEETSFGVEAPGYSTILTAGFQAEPQAAPSRYRASTRSGVYTGARLADDQLAITATGLNRHSCTVNIVHVNHL